MRSLVRSRLIGTPRRVYHGTTACSGALQADEVPGLARDRITVWLGPESRVVGAPVSQGEQIGFAAGDIRGPGGSGFVRRGRAGAPAAARR
ncbi:MULTISPECIES: hypothetical protein [unclassified Streptomyces]|uniref:hypothetical protein n=1 Tax=unclassified Streptomyces TaxID=2593676 RepID=UPI0020A66591|nr:hypothetical protein [Streptomyces sp. CNQ-509]